MNDVAHLFDQALGLHLKADELQLNHMAWRALVVFLVSITLVRMGDKRSLGRNAAFDAVLVIIFGSVMSRGINGQARFFPTLGAGFVLIALHWIVATLAVYSHGVSLFAKGRDRVLVRDGQMDRDAMRRSKVTEDDLYESLRARGKVSSIADVKEARLERNGEISVVPRE
jgi:uncharacterized membrane protein YcaP (DUF421 family)